MKGIAKADFQTDFLLEVSSIEGIAENLIPFRYSTKISFKAEKAKVPDPEPTVYTITYDLDGGSLVSGDTNPDCYSEASDTVILKNPVKAGYTFAGWTGTGLSVATMEVTIEKCSTGNREYKATWTENAPDTYTLTVTKGTGIATVSEGAAYEAGKEITLEYTLEDGYEFASWSSDDVTVTDNKFIMPAKAVTVTANACVITYNITCLGIEGAAFAEGDNQPTYTVESEDITLKNPTKAGYTFKGWNGTDLTGDENLTVTIVHGSTGFIAKLNAKLTETNQLPEGYKFALPTEAQWEYACRAGTETDLNNNKNIVNDWGNDANINEVAWYNYNSESKTHDVGTLASNSFGLYDMHGNAFELCMDWYSDYDSSITTDPTGPAGPNPAYDSGCVVRGGSWGGIPYGCNSWYRFYYAPASRDSHYGFRLALVPVPMSE